MAKIFDPTRKKYVKATPEEIVRQKFVKFLLSKGYPITNIRTEQTLELAGKQFRADIVVYKNSEPVMIVECKAPDVKINASTLEQAWIYNYVLEAKYLVLTNGNTILLCKVAGGQCQFLSEFLTYEQLQ